MARPMKGLFSSPLGDDRHIPLAVKYESSAVWPALREVFGVDPTGAAAIVALVDADKINAAVSYSRSKDYYASRQNHRLLSYRKVLGAVDSLDDRKLINHFRQRPGVRGWQSWMEATPELVHALDGILAGHGPLPLLMPRSPVLLRDAEGRPMDLPRTRAISRIFGGVNAINEAITSVDVRQDNGVPLTAPVIRIFNKDFSRNGRFYSQGTSHQNIPREARKRILIDGESVVELDYATLHPALLYARFGAPLPQDCYRIGDWERPLVKRAFLILINDKSLPSARLAIAHCAEMDTYGLNEQEAKETASRLIADIKAAHGPIAPAFHSDVGAGLMRIDSDMAQDVMKSLMRRGIVALPVHDSFLVPASKRHELEEAMMKAAYRVGLKHAQVDEAV